MPFKQHLSSQTETKTFGSNMCEWEKKTEEGDFLATEEGGGEARTLAKRESLNFCFPFPLGEEESFQGSEIVKCYFSSISFQPRGSLKSRGYSSLVTIPFQNVF